MGSSRFIHIPTSGSGGPGPVGPTPIWSGETQLLVYHPVVDSFAGYIATHTHNWICTWDDNYVEAVTLVNYGQWLFNGGGDDGVIIRWYDADPRGWWWQVGVNLIDDHPGAGTLGVDVTDGFIGSEDDGSCDTAFNIPLGQTKNSVLNYSEADPLGQCTGVGIGLSSMPSEASDFDPNFCVCNGEPNYYCLQVADVLWTNTGSVPPARLPTSMGARKYAYTCVSIP